MTGLAFGALTLEHVLTASIAHDSETIEMAIPFAECSYRVPGFELGRTFTVNGEIRETTKTDAKAKLDGLRAASDGSRKMLYPIEGGAVTAMLSEITWKVSAGSWFPGKYHIAWSATFLECEALKTGFDLTMALKQFNADLATFGAESLVVLRSAAAFGIDAPLVLRDEADYGLDLDIAPNPDIVGDSNIESGSGYLNADEQKITNKFRLTSGKTLRYVCVYFLYAAYCNMKFAVYPDNSGSPEGQSPVWTSKAYAIGASPGWNLVALDSDDYCILSDAGDYWMMFIADSSSYDPAISRAGVETCYWASGSYSGGWPDPLGSISYEENGPYSMYLTP